MTSSIHAGWAPPRDRFEPTSMPYHQVPGSRQFIGNDVALDGRKSATSALMSDALLKEEAMSLANSNYAGTESTAQRGSVSSRRGFGRPAPPKFTASTGKLQDDEAVSMFKRMDLNMDGHITHAELERALLFTPEIARRLDRTGDTVHCNLVRKIAKREMKLPEDQTFTLHEWVDFCREGSDVQNTKVQRFISAYNLREEFDFAALEQAQRLAKMHSIRKGEDSPLKPASSILERSASMKARAADALQRHSGGGGGRTDSSPSISGLGQVYVTPPSSRPISSGLVPVAPARELPVSPHTGPATTEPGGGPEEVWDATKGLIYTNHELTRQLQACIHKAEEDELKIRDCHANEKRLVLERQLVEEKLQLEMKIAADRLEYEYAAQAEATRRKFDADIAGFNAEADRKLLEEKRRHREELGIVSDEAAAAIAGLEGELEETRQQRNQLLVTEREWASRYEHLMTEKRGLEKDLMNRDAAIGGLEFSLSEAQEAAESLSAQLTQTETQLRDVTDEQAEASAVISNQKNEIKRLVQAHTCTHTHMHTHAHTHTHIHAH